MRNRILGGIGVIWGGGVLIFCWPQVIDRVVVGHHLEAYDLGQLLGVIFAALMLLVGLYYLIVGGNTASVEQKPTALTELALPHSGLGIASFRLGLFVVAFDVVAAIAIVAFPATPALNTLVGFALFGGVGMALLGLILGFVGLFRSDRRK